MYGDKENRALLYEHARRQGIIWCVRCRKPVERIEGRPVEGRALVFCHGDQEDLAPQRLLQHGNFFAGAAFKA